LLNFTVRGLSGSVEGFFASSFYTAERPHFYVFVRSGPSGLRNWRVYYRWRKSNTSDPRFGALIASVRILSEQACAAITRGSI